MIAGDFKASQCLLCAIRYSRWLDQSFHRHTSNTTPFSTFGRDAGVRSIHSVGLRSKISERFGDTPSLKGRAENHERIAHSQRPKKIGQGLKVNQDIVKSYNRPNNLDSSTSESRSGKNYNLIPTILQRLKCLSDEPEESPFFKSVGLEAIVMRERLKEFETQIAQLFRGWREPGWKAPPMLESLRQVYIDNRKAGLDAQLRFAFHGFVANHEFTKSDILNQASIADLRYPTEWYPATRAVQRTIHLHVGPTNSGKTYHALKRLEQAKSGVYAGPLRLLAHEVYSRLNAKGKACNLITGDERVIVDEREAYMSSCTVEMVPINLDVEVAVVDEIQMIGNLERGWAWTQAVLGLKAQELHLCGEIRAVPLIKELAAAMGDTLKIHHYERLSPLRTMTTSLDGNLENLRKGDCVVAFSRVGIHALRKDIEKVTKKRVAVVYGSLPPEIRAQQAKLFNDPDNDYDILVASDAIGMGLNLSIKRIVFETTSKHNGISFQTLAVSDIKQIAGRAGRYRTAIQAENDARDGDRSSIVDPANSKVSFTPPPSKSLGLVTSLEKIDLPIIRRAMESEAQPLLTAGILPPATIVTRFATYFPPATPFSYILLRLHELARMHPRFHLCALRDQIGIADAIQSIKSLTIGDRLTFCAAPASMRDPGMSTTLEAFARCVANQYGGGLLDIHDLNLEVLDEEVTADKQYLRQLETLHKSLVLYLWLSYRFTGIFTSRAMASHAKGLVEQNIDTVLAVFSANSDIRQKLKNLREKLILRQFKNQIEVEGVGADSTATIPAIEKTIHLSEMKLEEVVPEEEAIAIPA